MILYMCTYREKEKRRKKREDRENSYSKLPLTHHPASKSSTHVQMFFLKSHKPLNMNTQAKLF